MVTKQPFSKEKAEIINKIHNKWTNVLNTLHENQFKQTNKIVNLTGVKYR